MSAEADAYLSQHKIPEIMEFLCAQLVYAKPADPAAFLAQELRKLQAKQTPGATASASSAAAGGGSSLPSSALSLFSDAELAVMFSMLDPLSQGTLSSRQVAKALRDLGLEPAKAGVDPSVQQSFNVESFKKACRAAQ